MLGLDTTEDQGKVEPRIQFMAFLAPPSLGFVAKFRKALLSSSLTHKSFFDGLANQALTVEVEDSTLSQ